MKRWRLPHGSHASRALPRRAAQVKFRLRALARGKELGGLGEILQPKV